ncbi:MAG: PadR family transcriptional regulator [Thermosynechococcaceae cyanobacterium MS004]|nr:PadR family transcriptional regulator [Thermosynechococcaceae cyanobacterium MS004]
MKLQDIHHYFEAPKPFYLTKEMAVCYILSTLLERGESFGVEMMQNIEEENAGYRLSETVLITALKFLEGEGFVESYWLSVGKGRPRRMYQVKPRKRKLARPLADLWQTYQAKQTKSMIPERRFG